MRSISIRQFSRVAAGAVVAVAFFAGLGTRSMAAADDKDAAVPMSPEMTEALKKLSADPSNNADDTAAKLQTALTLQYRQTLAVQQVVLGMQKRLADELRQMTGAVVPANGLQVAGVIEFNEAVSRWTLEVLDLSEDQATPLLKWGLSDEHIALVAKAYNRAAETRADAVADVAKMDGPEADWLFLQLLNDKDRRVSLTAMDAAYDRKPTPAVVNALWNMAAGQLLNQVRMRPGRQSVVTVHGNPITVFDQDAVMMRGGQDAGTAADLLATYKDPSISDHIDEMFTEMAKRAEQQRGNNYAWRVMLPNYGNGGAGLTHLIQVSNPHAGVRFMMSALANIDPQMDAQTTNMNGKKMRISARMDAAAIALQFAGEKPEDYGLMKIQNWGGRWGVDGDEKEEAVALAKVNDWWDKHAKDFGGDAQAAKDTAATIP